jgi:hypothetical protein
MKASREGKTRSPAGRKYQKNIKKERKCHIKNKRQRERIK